MLLDEVSALVSEEDEPQRPKPGKTVLFEIPRNKATLSPKEFVRLFEMACSTLQRCLTFSYSFSVTIKPLAFLHRIVTALGFLPSQTPRTWPDGLLTADDYHVVLPHIHLHALRLLAAFLMCGRDHLVPYANTICAMLVRETKLVHLRNTVLYTSVASLHREISRCVVLCLDVWGSCIYTQLCENIVPHLLASVSKLEAAITAAPSPSKVVNKTPPTKKRKTARDDVDAAAVSNHDEITTLTPDMLLVAVVSSRTISSVLRTCGGLLPLTQHDTISQTIVRAVELILTREPTNPQFSTALLPALLRALLDCVLASRMAYTQSRHLAAAVHLFQAGMETRIPQICEVCSLALEVLEAYLHPRASPLYVPPAENLAALEIVDDQSTEKEQKTTEDTQPDFEERQLELQHQHERQIAALNQQIDQQQHRHSLDVHTRDDRIRNLENEIYLLRSQIQEHKQQQRQISSEPQQQQLTPPLLQEPQTAKPERQIDEQQVPPPNTHTEQVSITSSASLAITQPIAVSVPSTEQPSSKKQDDDDDDMPDIIVAGPDEGDDNDNEELDFDDL